MVRFEGAESYLVVSYSSPSIRAIRVVEFCVAQEAACSIYYSVCWVGSVVCGVVWSKE